MERPASSTRSRLLTVPRERTGERLDRFLRGELPADPARVSVLIAEGRVRIRGRTCSPLRKLFGGEQIEVSLPAPREPRSTAVEPSLPILAEDDDFLVVDKPAGLPVEPAGPASPSAVGAAARLRGCDVGGSTFPGLPHRIDRDTTGCLLLARTDAAMESLRRSFEEGRVEKEYLVLVEGSPPDEGRIDTPYGRDRADPRRFTTRVRSARRARLSYRVERRLPGAALVRVLLETGRTHQIRVQMAEAGWAVLGDATYGHPSPHLERQGLHAWRLAFPRPSGGARVEVEAPVPADLAGAVDAMARSAR